MDDSNGVSEFWKLLEVDQMIIGASTAGLAGFITNPLEVIKTRMQLQGELRRKGTYQKHYRNVFNAFQVIIRTEGLQGLVVGLGPSLLHAMIYNGIRLGTYEHLNELHVMHDADGRPVLWKRITCSGMCGVASMAFSSPFFLMKIQLQSQTAEGIAQGYQHHHNGMFEGLRSIAKTHGLRGLYKGYFPTVPRQFISSSSQLTTFDYCKEWVSESDFSEIIEEVTPIKTSIQASIIAGLVVSLVVSPLDLITTRFLNQKLHVDGQGIYYRSTTDCAQKIWRHEGIHGFAKGFWPSLLIRGPFTFLCLSMWDQVKGMYNQNNQELFSDFMEKSL